MTTRLQQLEERLRTLRAQPELEERRVFTRLREVNGSMRLEASDAQALARCAKALAGIDVEPVELPVEALRGRTAWVRASVADVRRRPSHGAEMVTQALQGEMLEPLLHEDGWLLVRLPDGYVGWVRDWHAGLVGVADAEAYARRVDARVTAAWLQVRGAASQDAPACAETVLGTRIVCLGYESGWAHVELPGGRRGWIPEDALRAGAGDWPTSSASILAMIERFGGAPYVWGGRSPKGFDCSGLVQFVFGLHGVALPRDSDQQFASGVAVDDVRAGDLLFFGRERIAHVAVACDAETYLHARGEVRRNARRPGHPLHDAELAALYRGCRRVLPASR